MSLSSALSKSVQVKFFDMSVFFIVSLITFRYFEIDERGLLSIFWATFFIIELLIMEFGVTAQAKIPDQIIKKENTKVQQTILSIYLVRSLSALLIGIFVYVFSEQISIIVTPENIDPKRLESILNIMSLFFSLNFLFGPVDHTTLIAFKRYEKMRLFLNMKIVPILFSALITLVLKESPEFMILIYIFIRFIIQSIVGWHSYFFLTTNKDIAFDRIFINVDELKSVSMHGIPLWISTLLAASLPHISILMLGENTSLESVAKFSLAMSIFMAAIAFVDMVDGWLIPKLSERKSKETKIIHMYINDFYNLYFYISTLFSILIIIFSELGVMIISGNGYADSITILIALSCFMNFRTLLIFRNVINVFNSTNTTLTYVIFKFVIEIISMLILIPIIGYYGILIAQLIAYFIIGQLFIVSSLSKVLKEKNLVKLFFNRYLSMALISSIIIGVLLPLHFMDNYFFYFLAVFYIFCTLTLIFKKKDVFMKILSS